ncbi:MAG: radical SAM protein [Candidatus Riflebacteria bacterium]|nr:radical SAM protein [Candidatus Riflebacteria bacterium]
MKKAYLHATKHPCTENAMNLNLLRRWFGGNEWGVVDDPAEADVIVVSTCGFSKEQEDYEIEAIRRLGETKKAGCQLVVLGCLPRINKERLKTVFDGATVPTESVERFDDLLALPRKTGEFDNHTVSRHEYNTDPKIRRYFNARRLIERLEWLPFVRVPRVLYTVPSERWWCVRCAMGCTGDCSYCGIKHAQGPFKSEPIERIMAQVKEGLAKGFREIALTGEDLGGYGVDMKLDLADLLREVVALPGKFQVNIRFIDPFWLIRLAEKLMPIFATGKVKAFCAPAQSGSDRILELMHRRYTFAQLKETVNRILKETPVGLISTNIIVGFPSETPAELSESLRLIDEVRFGMYMVFKYEDRPNTVASRLDGKIDDREKELRHRTVHRAAVKKHARSLLFRHP